MTPPTQIQFQAREERLGEIRMNANPGQVEQFGAWLKESGRLGYTLQAITELTDGTQRDPITTGLRIRLQKVAQ